ADNRISMIGQGVLSDMGGIYTLGPQAGTVIRGNRIHDVQSFSYGGWGIYPDEGSSAMLIENNCVFRTKSAGFHQHYGKENVIRNNVFAFGGEAQIMRTRAEDHLSFTMTRNVVLFGDAPLLGSNWSGDNYKLDENLYWRVGGKPFDFAGMTLDQWRAKGQDVHSVTADPLFLDPGHGDFRLKPNSPAIGVGFKPFPALAPSFGGGIYQPLPRAFP
ncbi:MAG TPA: right-handed parallel beta-helix repeat-containing protein, partial [Fimbriimonadaceae bacterium]|nr:right-handed parallel beta-helix repeat-containing protein [Fimbriimonadaceae bacterium]